jgi:hypothetical protein
MKRSLVLIAGIITVSFFLLISCTGRSENRSTGKVTSHSPGDTASIWFSDYEHDFGKVTAGEKVAYLFTYENRGSIPLVIASASTSCGCTVSKYSTKPLKPGLKGTMEVTFDTSGRSGKQTKTVTVRSNATREVVFLKITCEVVTGSNN